jgi:hypothetical protein
MLWKEKKSEIDVCAVAIWNGAYFIRLPAIQTPDATTVAATIPRIPYIHGSRPADCVDGFD